MRRSGRRARASLKGGGDACAILISGTAVCPWTFAGTNAPTNAVKIAAVLIHIVASARTLEYLLRSPIALPRSTGEDPDQSPAGSTVIAGFSFRGVSSREPVPNFAK